MYDQIVYLLMREIWLQTNKKKKRSKVSDIIVTESFHFSTAARARVVVNKPARFCSPKKDKGQVAS